MIDRLPKFVRSLLRGKPDPFLDLYRRYAQRLQQFPPVTVDKARGVHVGVLITPWLSTGVPLFSLEIALRLASLGCRVTAFLDISDVVGNAPSPSHGAALRKLLTSVSGQIETVVVSDEPKGTPDAETARCLLGLNAIWRARGEGNAGSFLAANPEAEAKMAAHLGRVEEMLRRRRFDWILSPGGIFGLSGLYVAAARRTKTSFSTFDSGVGLLRLAHDFVAAHLGDIPRAVAAVHDRWSADPAEKARVLLRAQDEINDRAAARDARQFQVAAATQGAMEKYDILVPLNIRWDSAALGRQRVFESIREWLRALGQWALAHPTATICIRQHPRERLEHLRGSDDWPALLAEFAALGPRLRWVGAEEKLNTYDLLREAKVVLPHTSTFGIEASFLGTPVILATDCYYEALGFAWPAYSREEYFHLIEKALDGTLAVSAEQREEAGLAYFLTQRCTQIRSDFNPHRENFLKWSQLSPEALWETPENEDFSTALLTREPLPAVRYHRLVQA